MKRNKLYAPVLLVLSVIFLSLSQPSFLFKDGLSFCAWFCYVPFFLLADRVSLKASFIYGAFYGFFSYLLMCPWLSSFGAVAVLFVCFLFAFYNSILFFLLSWSKKIFPGQFEPLFWIFRALLVLSVEFLRTNGIFAFSYGIIGYSQWKLPAFLKFSSLFGVWGVSFIILLFNSVAAKIVSEKNLRANVRKLSFSLALVLSVFAWWAFSSLLEGEKSYKTLSVALIQNATSAPSCKILDYERDVLLLERLSDEALAKNPETELVVWAETAVVPDILLNLDRSEDRRRHALASFLIEYLKGKDAAFLIGNNHADKDGTHNSALYFTPETVRSPEVYNKNHLVPFTEFWPDFLDFKVFEPIKASLDCELFAHGNGVKVFSIKDMKFAVPICFEDSFSPLLRKMKKAGADFFVNISDDAWAHCEEAQNMHLSMSVFRCAEYSSPMLRSTIDGKTCRIDEKGKVTESIESGIDSFLCGKLSVPETSPEERRGTFYLFAGDVPVIAICFLIFAILLILSARFVKVNVYGRR